MKIGDCELVVERRGVNCECVWFNHRDVNMWQIETKKKYVKETCFSDFLTSLKNSWITIFGSCHCKEICIITKLFKY